MPARADATTSPHVPTEIWQLILAQLPYASLKQCAGVNKLFRSITALPAFDAALFREPPSPAPARLEPEGVKLHPAFALLHAAAPQAVADVYFAPRAKNGAAQRVPLAATSAAAEFATRPAQKVVRIRVKDFPSFLVRSERGVTVLQVMAGLCHFFRQKTTYVLQFESAGSFTVTDDSVLGSGSADEDADNAEDDSHGAVGAAVEADDVGGVENGSVEEAGVEKTVVKGGGEKAVVEGGVDKARDEEAGDEDGDVNKGCVGEAGDTETRGENGDEEAGDTETRGENGDDAESCEEDGENGRADDDDADDDDSDDDYTDDDYTDDDYTDDDYTDDDYTDDDESLIAEAGVQENEAKTTVAGAKWLWCQHEPLEDRPSAGDDGEETFRNLMGAYPTWTGIPQPAQKDCLGRLYLRLQNWDPSTAEAAKTQIKGSALTQVIPTTILGQMASWCREFLVWMMQLLGLSKVFGNSDAH